MKQRTPPFLADVPVSICSRRLPGAVPTARLSLVPVMKLAPYILMSLSFDTTGIFNFFDDALNGLWILAKLGWWSDIEIDDHAGNDLFRRFNYLLRVNKERVLIYRNATKSLQRFPTD